MNQKIPPEKDIITCNREIAEALRYVGFFHAHPYGYSSPHRPSTFCLYPLRSQNPSVLKPFLAIPGSHIVDTRLYPTTLSFRLRISKFSEKELTSEQRPPQTRLFEIRLVRSSYHANF
jgi:hypothetical protein